MYITQIVAIDKKGMIGSSDYNGMLWKCSSDLKRFKKETLGHNVIMGRTTFESIGKPLPGRLNIVMTKNLNWKAPFPEVLVAHNVDHALNICDSNKKIYVIGGAEIYDLFQSISTNVHLTEIDVDSNGNMPYPLDLSRFELYEEKFYEKENKDDAEQKVKLYRLRID